MIADAVAPAREPHDLADIALTKCAAGMGAITMHRQIFALAGGTSQNLRCEAREKRMGGRLCQAADLELIAAPRCLDRLACALHSWF